VENHHINYIFNNKTIKMNKLLRKGCVSLILTAAWLTFPNVSATEPEAVDLGIGVKFASSVLGASDSNPFSTFFWGETEPVSSMTKKSEMETVDMNDDISGTLYDAAYIRLGDKWRLPTASELEKLAACDWQPATVNGRTGWTVSAGGASIFIPKTATSSGVSVASLWSSTCKYDGLSMPKWRVQILSFKGSEKPEMQTARKGTSGIIILPVLNERSGTKVESLSLVESSVKLMAGKTARIYPKIGPVDAADKKLVWTSGNPEIATISDKGVVTGVAAGETSVTVSTADGSELSVKCAVTVEPAPEPVERKVDLGLSVIWSAYNLGSDGFPTSVGDYYAFAELEPKESYAQSQYVYNSYNGQYSIPVENIQGSEYDVARKAWGESWCIPTKEQIEELIANCTANMEYEGDVRGYRFTSKINGNSIFIPAAGYKYYSDTREIERVYLWSATAKTPTGWSASAYCLSSSFISSREPCYGMCIRPVFLLEKEVTSIEIEPKEVTMVKGTTEKLEAIALTSDGSEVDVKWSSDAPEIATVDADGLVTAVAVGVAKITATAGQKSAECIVTVQEDASTGADLTIADGETGDVYSIAGVKLLSDVNVKANMALPSGLYIIRYRSGRTQKIVIY